MTELESARKRWLEERSRFEQFGREVADRLRSALKRQGIWGEVQSRAKDVDSLVRKLVKKSQHSYESLSDKAGIRVIVRYKSQLEIVGKIAGTLFQCAEPDNKISAMEPNQVGYLGVHIDLRLKQDDAAAKEYPADHFRGELQIRTLAQHLWSEMSHDTFYKNDETLQPLPPQAKRRIYVLAGVVELADEEFDRVNSEMPTTPEVELLKALERHFYKLTTRSSDPETSLEVIRLLAPLYHQETRQIESHLEDFYTRHEATLHEVYEQAADAPERSAFLYQPEALMIYDLLEADALGTREAWGQRYPDKELERIANAFGISFD
jgi:putative GTP pyrophosphokinase